MFRVNMRMPGSLWKRFCMNTERAMSLFFLNITRGTRITTITDQGWDVINSEIETKRRVTAGIPPGMALYRGRNFGITKYENTTDMPSMVKIISYTRAVTLPT